MGSEHWAGFKVQLPTVVYPPTPVYEWVRKYTWGWRRPASSQSSYSSGFWAFSSRVHISDA